MIRIWLLCGLFVAGWAFPQNQNLGYVALSSTTTTPTSTPSSDKSQESNEVPLVPKIYEMSVFSNVSNRFASTSITSKVKNYGTKAEQATFEVVLPDSAYITGFTMQIDGKNYTAYIKEKEEAKQIYDQAVQSGIGAAHVTTSVRHSNRFTVDVNIEPQSKAIFYLFYEELLKRTNNYEIVLNIQPKQPVPNLNVEVQINEAVPLTTVKTPALRSGNGIPSEEEELDPRSTITRPTPNSAIVKFSPSEEKQKEYAKKLGTSEKEGLSGQFVVQYDVERQQNGGEILLKDGYFVHFFAPSEIEILPKHIVFVLDTSGSMYGQRIVQLKEAMNSILNKLNKDDLFSLVEFDSETTVWDIYNQTNNVKYPKHGFSAEVEPIDNLTFPSAYKNDPDNVKKAIDVINLFQPNGGTNIYEGIKVGLHLIKLENEKAGDNQKKSQPIIMFLTDGEPTVGVTSLDEILAKISEINFNVPIFSLSFGDGADRKFLQKLSLQNNAFARHIYESADASLQLEGFYKEISSPLLANVTFDYADDAKQLTRTNFPNYFLGGEIIVCGYYEDRLADVKPIVKGWGGRGFISLKPDVKNPIGDMERVWAYLTVQQLLEEQEKSKNNTEVKDKALKLALKYSFVTPLTSLVVVKPNATEKPVDAVAADKTPDFDKSYSALLLNRAPARPFSAARPQFLSGHSGGIALAASYPQFAPGAGFGGVSYNLAGQPAPSFAFPPQSLPPSRYPFPLSTTFRPMDVYDSVPDDLLTETAAEPDIGISPDSIVDDNKSTEHVVLTKLKQALSWLTSIYNQITDSITLSSGTYKLGINDNVDETKECNNAPNNATGHCTLLHHCSKIHNEISTLEKYIQHHCIIDTYAGVCCPQ